MDIKKEIEKNISIKINRIFQDKPFVLANISIAIKTKPFNSIILNNLTLVRSPNYNERLSAPIYLTTPYSSNRFNKIKIYYILLEDSNAWETIEYLVYKKYLEAKEVMPKQNKRIEIDRKETLEDILNS